MSDSEITRRDVLRAAGATMAAAGFAAIGGGAADGADAPGGAATKPAPMMGIQMAVGPLLANDISPLLADMRQRAGVNALFPFIYTHLASQSGLRAGAFRGGNFAMPHMQYYKGTNLTFQDMRAPEAGNVDVLQHAIDAGNKIGTKVFAWVLEDNARVALANWQGFYEVDFHGRRRDTHPSGPCYNNPGYRGYVLGLAEDYTRSYDIGGYMWSSERQGGLFNALGAYHHGATADPGGATCFCDYCIKKGKDRGIDVDRARRGFTELEAYVRAGRSRQRPRDGAFVGFFRLLLKYPELLAWESLWIDSRADLQKTMYQLIKSIKPAIPVGWHIWHNVSFSPFHRAEMDYAAMASYSDFIKPVLYNNCAGERIKSFTDSVCQNVFADVPPAEALPIFYEMLNYQEAPYDRVLAAGLSADYVARETRRTLDDGGAGRVAVWPGIDIDVPVPAGAGRCTAQSVKAAVVAAFKAAAPGVILCRNYSEMDPQHLAGAGDALKELGL
jgi:hypothetical protein